jgi:glycylpeptide N-tetradecanoyltransferase
VGFAGIARGGTMARMIRDNHVPSETVIPGFRDMEKKDVKAVARLLRAYLLRMDMTPLLKNKEIEHLLIGGRGKVIGNERVGQVVWTYVVEVKISSFFRLSF